MNINASYTTTPTCTGTPTTVGTFTLVVWARLLGHTTKYDKDASLTYQVTPQPITAVALATEPGLPAIGLLAGHTDRHADRRERPGAVPVPRGV